MESTIATHKTNSNDINLKKIFELRMKQGHEIKKAYVGESDFLRTVYFLKGSKVYTIDISSSKLAELEFTRGKEVCYISGNSNNDYLLVVLKDGRIYAIDSSSHAVKHLKNLYVTSLILDMKKVKDKEMLCDNLKFFASQSLDKIVLANEKILVIWYKNDMMSASKSKSEKNQEGISELWGTFYSISLDNEKKLLLPNESVAPPKYFESLSAVFNNNYYLGSFARIFYVLLVPKEHDSYKIILVDYLFRFDSIEKFKSTDSILSKDTAIPRSCLNESVRGIEKRSSYSFLICNKENIYQNNNENKERILLCFNKTGNCCAIIINFMNECNSTLLMCMTETFRFTSYKLSSLFNRVGTIERNRNRPGIWVDCIEWICNDLFLVILFQHGNFVIVNLNFQVMSFVDNSNSIIIDEYCKFMSCPVFFASQKLKSSDKLQLLSSKKRTDYFIVYSNNYFICFQVNYKKFESKILSLNPSSSETFEDFLYELKFFQISYNPTESEQLFKKIHTYLLKSMQELYITGHEQVVSKETVPNVVASFVKFIRIFRSTLQIHETNLTILSYLIGISNDFLLHLINRKEIWLAYLFLTICENYLLKQLRLKATKNKLSDEQLAKGQTSYLVINSYNHQNISLKCYNKIVNRALHSRLRLLLLFFSLFEFRNNQALNINVLYFILAKMCVIKLRKHNLLDDIHLVVKVLIRNWKFLRTENQKVGGEQYVLSSLTMNNRTENLSQFIHSSNSRDDIKFDFFAEFYSIEELKSYVGTNETYCRGEEEALINEYNYINNVGIIQKWILFFTNYFYMFLFEDIRSYMDNHLKQVHNPNKSIDNISPEERNLSSLIYFNMEFFFLCLNSHLRFFLKYMTNTTEYSNEFSYVADQSKILDEFAKVMVPFISPIDVPFLIFEFYVTEDNIQRKNSPFEIIQNLNTLIVHYSKIYNHTLIDMLDYIDFLIANGFKYFPDNLDADVDNIKCQANAIQRYIYSALLFFLFTIHKFNLIHCLENNIDLILAVIERFETSMRKDCYEYLFITMNGQLKYYLTKVAMSKLSLNQGRYLEIILTMLKILFNKILREEPSQVRINIFEYVFITPSVMKPCLLEGAIYYEYKNFNNFLKKQLFSFNDILNIKNFNWNYKISNIFEALITDNSSKVIEYIFNQNNSIKDMHTFHSHFAIALNNLLFLTKIWEKEPDRRSARKKDKDKDQEYLIFNIESNRDYIRMLIHTTLTETFYNGCDEKAFQEVLFSMFDKIIKGNFDNKAHYKFSSIELKNKLVRSIKITIAKILHMLNLIYVKYKIFATSPQHDIINYIKMISYCLLFENNQRNALDWSLKILDYFISCNLKDLNTENDMSNAAEAIKILNIVYVKFQRNLSALPKMCELEEKIIAENKDILNRYKPSINEDLEKIKEVIERTKLIKSNNLQNFIISCYCDFSFEINAQVLSQIISYLVNNPVKIPMRTARKYYMGYCDSFYKLTGIPPKNSIDFDTNWELVDNDNLYHCIISDDMDSIPAGKDEDKNNYQQNLIMNRRQRFGADTPKRRKDNLQLTNNSIKTYSVEKITLTPRSHTSSDSVGSIDVREENIQQRPPQNKNQGLKIKVKRKMHAPKYKSNINNLSPEKRTDFCSSIRHNKIFKFVDDIKNGEYSEMITNIAPIETASDGYDGNDNQEPLAKLFVNKITRVFFRRLMKLIFLQYRRIISERELEEIKIVNVNPKDASVELIVLREKFITSKELEKPCEGETGLPTEIKQSNQDSVSRLKPLDIINVNKYTAENGDNSKLYKASQKQKNGSKIQETIKNKLEEIKTKLSKYEAIVNHLGNEFDITNITK